jgi:outer membrane protein assembly factor BamB
MIGIYKRDLLQLINGIIFSILFLILPSLVFCQEDITGWRGPFRNGIYQDKNLKSIWPEGGPEVLLKIEGIGKGYSSPAIYDKKIFITGIKDSIEILFAYDLKGTLLWEKAFGKAWHGTYPDSRNMPAIENDLLYISSGSGEIACIRTGTGEIVWKKNPFKEYKGAFSTWGMAESILLTDNAVIYGVGGKDASAVALDKKTGNLIWKSPPTGDKKAYTSPLLIERNGKKIILVVLSDNILGIDPLKGEILWTFNLVKDLTGDRGRRNNINTPLYKNGEIFISSGYDADAVMLSLSEDGNSVRLKWKNPVLDNHYGGVVEVNGYIYGSTWQTNTQGNWACLEWNTGKVMYEENWFNKGPIIYADGHLYCMEEKSGNIALVQPDPSGFRIKSSFRLKEGSGPYWAHPVIYDGKLFIRHGEIMMVYNIRS